MIALKNRVHLFTHPKNKEPLIDCFTKLLAGNIIAAPTSLAFQFVDGSAVSVDFTEEVVDALDEQQARRGAWLELETDEPSARKREASGSWLSPLRVQRLFLLSDSRWASHAVQTPLRRKIAHQVG